MFRSLVNSFFLLELLLLQARSQVESGCVDGIVFTAFTDPLNFDDAVGSCEGFDPDNGSVLAALRNNEQYSLVVQLIVEVIGQETVPPFWIGLRDEFDIGGRTTDRFSFVSPDQEGLEDFIHTGVGDFPWLSGQPSDLNEDQNCVSIFQDLTNANNFRLKDEFCTDEKLFICSSRCPPTPSPSTPATLKPSAKPTFNPTTEPTILPTSRPSSKPSTKPSLSPSIIPSLSPSSKPTKSPDQFPSANPTSSPQVFPTTGPTATPSSAPTTDPTAQPSTNSTAAPSSLLPSDSKDDSDVAMDIAVASVMAVVVLVLLCSLYRLGHTAGKLRALDATMKLLESGEYQREDTSDDLIEYF